MEDENSTISGDLVYALILTPTRELALQIFDILKIFQEKIGSFGVKCNSGGKKGEELSCGEGKHIIVATPGRINALLLEDQKSKSTLYRELKYLVLDEADRLLDSNFQLEVKDVILKLPKQRRTGLFSATLTSKKIEELIKVGLRNPAVIKLSVRIIDLTIQKKGDNQHEVPKGLENSYIKCSSRVEKIFLLMKLLFKHKDQKTIVFFNTCHEVSFYQKLIGRWIGDRSQVYGKIAVQKITGNMDQAKRVNNLTIFNQSKNGVMMATDVIARGIDFDHVDLIIQVDVPQDPSFYIHRIGRTARKGLDGHAILLLNKNELDYVDYMGEKQIPLEEHSDQDIKKHKLSELDQFATKIRKMMLVDKDFIIKGSKAYVSFVRSYDEHKVSSIFKTQDLDFEEIAKSFFLFKVPFIKELKGKNQSTIIATEEELKQLEKVEFVNKNQAQMIAKKIEQDKEKSKLSFCSF